MSKLGVSAYFDKYINVVQSFALLVTLGIVAVQARDQSYVVEQQEFGSLIEQQHAIFELQIDYGELYVKSLMEPASLSVPEIWKIAELIYLRIELLERFQKGGINGIISEADVASEFADTQIYLNTPIGRLVWKQARIDYGVSSQFVRRIESALANNDMSSDDEFLQSLVALHRERFLSDGTDAAEPVDVAGEPVH
jgi:hypothetical protein